MSGIYFRPSYSLCLIEQPNTIEKKLQLTEKNFIVLMLPLFSQPESQL